MKTKLMHALGSRVGEGQWPESSVGDLGLKLKHTSTTYNAQYGLRGQYIYFSAGEEV